MSAALLRGLDQDVRGLLAAASVLGTDFGVALAAAVRGTGQEVTGALSAAAARGLVGGPASRVGIMRGSRAARADKAVSGWCRTARRRRASRG
jgi:hypothetical protein